MKRKIIVILFVCFVILFVDVVVFRYVYLGRKAEISEVDKKLPIYTMSDLKKYDGSKENEKILIGLNGLVYDVTAGSEYYKKGGVYNYLAGKDSSTELNMIGGSIIKRKYPVIGRF